MEKLPRSIAKAVEKAREEYQFYVSVKKINGKYYLYKQSGTWDTERRKTKIVSEYLGRITEEGMIVKKKFSAKEDLENAKALIAEHGGEIVWKTKASSERVLRNKEQTEIDEIDLRILTLLSMDSRRPIDAIAKELGIGSYAARNRITRLEKELGVEYVLELDLFKLGFIPYVTFVKFLGRQPSRKELSDALRSSTKIQFAARLKGEYDLFIYSIDEEPIKAYDSMHELRLNSALKDYDSEWYTSPFSQTYSFVPLRDEFIEYIAETKEWKRSIKRTHPNTLELTHREAVVLRELNTDSTKDFAEIDQENGLGRGGARYAYSALVEGKIVVRPTIAISGLQVKYLGGIMLDIISADDAYRTWRKRLPDYISDGPVANKYSLVGYIGLPDSLLLLLPVINDGELERTADFLHETTEKGVRKRVFVVTEVIIGSLCYRRLDNRYSRHYEILSRLKEENESEYAEIVKPTNADVLIG